MSDRLQPPRGSSDGWTEREVVLPDDFGTVRIRLAPEGDVHDAPVFEPGEAFWLALGCEDA